MDTFEKLDSILSSQDSRFTTPSSYLSSPLVGVPSTSIGLISQGEITSHVISNQEISDCDADTLFQACSISKPVGITAIFRYLATTENAPISLTTRITDCLSPQQLELISTPAIKPLLAHVTVAGLMSHSGGMSVGGFLGYPLSVALQTPKSVPDSPSTIVSGQAPVNSLQVHPMLFPGQAFSYSGGGMTVLEMIIETATSTPFAEFVKKHLLEPLSMTRSFYELPNPESNLARAFVNGNIPCTERYHLLPEKLAAGLWTTPSDLLKLVHAIQKSLRGEDPSVEFLPKSWAQKMLSEVAFDRAHGWSAPKSTNSFQHSGSNEPGYRCILVGYGDLAGTVGRKLQEPESSNVTPEEKMGTCVRNGEGFAVMTNSGFGYTLYNRIWNAIAYLKGWPERGGELGDSDTICPFMDRKIPVSKRWLAWKGTWGPDSEWTLDEASADKPEVPDQSSDAPVVKFKDLPAMGLCVAAVPPYDYAAELKRLDRDDPETEGIELVVEGLEVWIRLGWKGGSRVIKVVAAGKEDVLERSLAKV
ncbi:hypothetical protein MMC25_006482 [Agyrium rufum]|nr:hypothetical protein [Agyrium rufum]